MTVFYRPHPKDGEGTVFTGVCLFTPRGGGTPVLGSFPGYWSQVLSRRVQVRGGTPVLARGYPSQDVVPHPGQEGYPLLWPGIAQPGQEGVPPGQVRMG